MRCGKAPQAEMKQEVAYKEGKSTEGSGCPMGRVG